jgi:polysaccharide export outer membrane protein
MLAICMVCAGCGITHHSLDDDCPEVPHELKKVSQPPYVIEPPDTLLIDAIRLIPRPPYRVEPLDNLGIQVTNTLPNAPIAGVYSVDPEGVITLGFTYGSVNVLSQTLEEVKTTIERHLKKKLLPPYEVTVVLVESRALQQIRGEHLVRPDGTVALGTYGSVLVDGLTLVEAKEAIEAHLSRFLLNPEIALDVSGYNSKVYYVITDGGGYGEQVFRLPSTGKETVLDAIALIGGLPPVASKRHIWLARPAPSETDCVQTLPVNWIGITQQGLTATNYQVLPGDRIYVKSAPLITTDTYLARFIAPFERIMGFALIGRFTERAFEQGTGGTGGSTGGGFGGTGR